MPIIAVDRALWAPHLPSSKLGSSPSVPPSGNRRACRSARRPTAGGTMGPSRARTRAWSTWPRVDHGPRYTSRVGGLRGRQPPDAGGHHHRRPKTARPRAESRRPRRLRPRAQGRSAIPAPSTSRNVMMCPSSSHVMGIGKLPSPAGQPSTIRSDTDHVAPLSVEVRHVVTHARVSKAPTKPPGPRASCGPVKPVGSG